MKLIRIFTFFLLVGFLSAKNFTVSNIKTIKTGNAAFDSTLNSVINSEFAKLEKEANSQLNLDLTDFARGMADSAATAVKGLLVDYASNPTILVVGAGINFALNTGTTSLANVLSNADNLINNLVNNQGVPQFGLAAQVSLMAGVSFKNFSLPKLGFIDPGRMTGFVNFWAQSLNFNNFNTKFMNIGAHIQYDIIETKKLAAGSTVWGGIDFTTGISYAFSEFLLSTNLPAVTTSSTNVGGSTADMQLSWSGKSKLGTNAKIFSIPFEVSTNVRFAYFLTFFTGVGIDLQFGSGRIIAGLAESSITGTIENGGSTGIANGTQVASADVIVDFGTSQSPTFGNIRIFFGPQIEISVVKLFFQTTFALNNTYSGLVGVKIAW